MLYQAHSKGNWSKNQWVGVGLGRGGGVSDSTDQLILTLCLRCGTQAPVGGAELWAEKAQQAHSNDA